MVFVFVIVNRTTADCGLANTNCTTTCILAAFATTPENTSFPGYPVASNWTVALGNGLGNGAGGGGGGGFGGDGGGDGGGGGGTPFVPTVFLELWDIPYILG